MRVGESTSTLALSFPTRLFRFVCRLFACADVGTLPLSIGCCVCAATRMCPCVRLVVGTCVLCSLCGCARALRLPNRLPPPLPSYSSPKPSPPCAWRRLLVHSLISHEGTRKRESFVVSCFTICVVGVLFFGLQAALCALRIYMFCVDDIYIYIYMHRYTYVYVQMCSHISFSALCRFPFRGLP